MGVGGWGGGSWTKLPCLHAQPLTVNVGFSVCGRRLYRGDLDQPENLLLVNKEDDANLKIADFGFAKRHDANSEVLRAQCGTPGCE